MANRDFNRIRNRITAVFCFIVAAILTSFAVWLYILGDFPAIQTGDHSYMMFGGMSINGVDMPSWAFYLIPGALFVFGVGLWFAGWRMSMRGHDDA
jgi:hypothetical protein